MAPSPGEIILGCLAVVAGCIGAAAALRSGVRTGNVFAYVCALGCAAFVAGVIGQRTFPSAETTRRLGAAAANSVPGPWDAGVTVPLIGVRLTPVAVAGLLLTAVACSLLLLFERVPGDQLRPARWLAPLDEDDSV